MLHGMLQGLKGAQHPLDGKWRPEKQPDLQRESLGRLQQLHERIRLLFEDSWEPPENREPSRKCMQNVLQQQWAWRLTQICCSMDAEKGVRQQ